MLKIVAAALAAAVVVTGLPIQSQAGGARGDRGADCRLCKMFTHKRVRATKPVVRRAVRAERRMFAWPKRVRSESLFKRAPREARPVVRRTERRMFAWPKRVRSESLFKRAPREARPVVRRTERRMFTWTKRVRSESLFKRAPREARPVVKRTRREWKPMFTTRRAHTRVKRAR